MLPAEDSLDLRSLGERLRSGNLRPREVVAGVLERIAARGDDKVWIHLAKREVLAAQAEVLERRGPEGLPLYGIPFAVKDNIDVAGQPTTAACPAFAYTPRESAPVVQRLLDAGAIAIGKTNLDQFATGLVGTRSPYGACANAFDAKYISGGSSSGSAVAVAAGLVSFALGTDTAGPGRVPAAFNNIVGLKPTRGLLSTRGVAPACRSLDCVSIFGLTAEDARAVLAVARGFDSDDPFSRRRVRVGCRASPTAGSVCRGAISSSFSGTAMPSGSSGRRRRSWSGWGRSGSRSTSRRFSRRRDCCTAGRGWPSGISRSGSSSNQHAEKVFPVTREILGGAARYTASDAFAAQYRLEELRRRAESVWEEIDFLVTPTAGTIYTIEEVNADPIRLNSNLGYYTNFMNLLDLAAIAVPAGFQKDGLAFGITLAGPAFSDEGLCALGGAVHRRLVERMGATAAKLPTESVGEAGTQSGFVKLAVCGAHMSGLPLNHQLTERGGRLVRTCRTAPRYRLFALTGLSPPRPGMVRAESGGHAIEVEVWALPTERRELHRRHSAAARHWKCRAGERRAGAGVSVRGLCGCRRGGRFAARQLAGVCEEGLEASGITAVSEPWCTPGGVRRTTHTPRRELSPFVHL
jgi:allophanate hydrolase